MSKKTKKINKVKTEELPMWSLMANFPRNAETLFGKDVITLGKLRWWFFQRNFNGFSECAHKKSGRIYINTEKFMTWFEKI